MNDPDVVEPSDEWKYRFIKGRTNEPIPRQYCNWAAQYLGRHERFGYGDHRLAIGINILNDACVKYLEDVGVLK